jgi:hypothetical protein
VTEFLTALGLLTWGFLMGAAWQSWREQNRRARALRNVTELRPRGDRRA